MYSNETEVKSVEAIHFTHIWPEKMWDFCLLLVLFIVVVCLFCGRRSLTWIICLIPFSFEVVVNSCC